MVVIGCGASTRVQPPRQRPGRLLRPPRGSHRPQRQSWKNATENGFTVGTYEELLPTADVVLNLTPDKQHTNVVETIMPMMKHGACLSYSHGNIVEEGMQIRDDITVIMVAPSAPAPRCVPSTSVASACRPSSPSTRTTTPTAKASPSPRPTPSAPVATKPGC